MLRLFAAALLMMFASSVSLGNIKEIWAKELSNLNMEGRTETWHYREDGLNANKKSEALIYVPSQSVPDDITIIFWFHGCGGYSDRTFDVRLAQQLNHIESSNHSYALVVPELLWSKNTKTKCGRQSRSFRKPGSLVYFVSDSVRRIDAILESTGREKTVNPRLVFIGHSAGGSVFKAAALSGDLCKVNPDMVVWSDSTYGNWFNVAWSRCLHKGGSNVVVLIRKWTKTWKSFRSFSKKSKPSIFLDVKYYGGKIYHKTIGDNAIQFAEVFPEGC